MNNFVNLDIERGVLAAIIFDGFELEKVKNMLDKKDFYLPFHQDMFEAMETLYKKDYPIDEVMIREELTKQNKFDESLMLEVITTAPISGIEIYAKEIKELSLKRQIEKLFNQSKIKLLSESDADSLEIIENLKQELENLNKSSYYDFQFKNFKNVENRDVEFILEDFLPLPKKAVTLLSAKGGAGKSWLVLQLALRYINQYPDRKAFAWLSEDPDFATKKRAEKILAEILTDCNYTKFNDINHQNYNNFSYLGSETRPFHFIDYDFKNKKINNLFYKLKYSLKDYDFIILDPLIAFFGGDENNNSQAREFMNLLTEWADKENKAILVVHHNNKNSNSSIRGASAFVDAVRLYYELLMNENNDKKENTEVLPAGYRKIQIQKDNWGVERILGKKEIEIKIFNIEIKKRISEEGINYGGRKRI
jgi:replicative DNA helicase